MFALDTSISATVTNTDDYDVLKTSMNKINDYEKLFSKTIKDSDINKLNYNKNVEFSTLNKNTVEILKIAEKVSNQTNGAFDFTLGNISDLWQFTSQNPKVPSNDEITKQLQCSGYKNFSIKNNSIVLNNNINIDLGGIAKGYITDLIVSDLKENGVDSAMLSLGGNVFVLGNKNNKKWKVGIANPSSPNNIVGYVEVSDKSVVTSGNYQRYFEENGKIYHHILDSQTGYPANSGLKSVTIICDNSTLADAYSTAFFVMGVDKSIKFLKDNNVKNIDAIFITSQDKIICTNNAKKIFTPTN